MAELVLGRLKFNWKGNWAATTAYIKDDVVKYGPSAWVCIENHTSTNEFDFAKFQLMAEGVSWAGEWNDSTSYQVNDIVNYGGAIYVCVLDHAPGDSTDTSPNSLDFWQRLVGGLEWESEYSSLTTYQKGDIVRYGGYTYICTQTSTNNVPTNTLYWAILNQGYIFLGEYTAIQEYLPGHLVRYGAKVYACTTTITGTAPPDASYWIQFSDGFKWRNTWSSGSVSYIVGDVVRYGARSYVCIQNNTSDSSTIIPSNATYWNLFNDGQRWTDTWDLTTTYVEGDIVKYGARSYICIEKSLGYLPTNATYWQLIVDGFQWGGTWSESSVNYKIGDVVRYGARSYVCILGHTSSPSISPADPTYWDLVNKGLDWKGAWNSSTVYKLDDVVEYSGSSYVCVQEHASDDSSLVRPDLDNGSYWNAVAVGDISSPMTTTGDMIYRNSGGGIVRLPIGPSGSFLVVNNGIPSWGVQAPEQNYYVSLTGDDNNDGRTVATAWRTLQHACSETYSLGQCKISILSGTYTELCPIKVGRSVVIEGDGLGAVTISPENSADKGYGVGISKDGSTPNANSEVFHVNNGARLRNLVFRGFGSGAVCVSLDPGYGPNDTSVWITSQSPYIQNCTSFTDLGTGMVIDGALHNGGYKSIVANDWTQINSDGIGFIVKNDGRSELVSCFTYYCHIGYLCESGGKIRSVGGNNSYGEFGAVARGFSQSETPLTGFLQLSDDTITSVQTFTSNVHIFTSYKDFNGNLFCVGHTSPTGTTVTSSWSNSASNPFIAKFTAAGTLDWAYTYTSNYGAVHSIVEIDNTYYAGGVIYDGVDKGWLLKISASGEIQWQKTVGDTDEIVDVTTDGTSFLYALGNHTTNGATLIKVQPSGIISWSRTLDYNDSSIDTLTASSICYAGTPTTSTDTYAAEGDATAEDDLYIACRDTTANVAMIVRVDNSGNLVNAYNYGNLFINKLRLDTGNGDGIYMMAAGYYDPAGGVAKSPLLMRLDILGNVEWQTQITSGSSNGEWLDVIPLGDDVYVSGYLNDGTNTYNRGLLSRFTSNGTETWSNVVTNSTENVWFTGITLDGVNVICSGNNNSSALITNIQRDETFGLGTVTSGSWTITSTSPTIGTDTVATKNIQNIYAQSPSIGLSDSGLTLNQSPGLTRTTRATRTGFAGIGTGVQFTINGLSRTVKAGSVLQITGNNNTYFVISVANFDIASGSCSIAIDPSLPSNLTPDDNTLVTFREAFSQVRMTSHDFLDIGSGGFADTNYPVIIASDYTQQPDPDKEIIEESGGRCFYVTTDQDGNFRVGNYFKVEQSTGRATLSSEEFDLSGLNELQLGSITAGRQGATVNEFSTDGTFSDNSDTAVPTERATKTYVDNKIGAATTVKVGTAPNETKLEVTGTGTSTDTIDLYIAGNLKSRIANQFLLLPKGDTASRPGSPVSGYIRYNTSLNALEIYNGTSWVPAGGFNNVNLNLASGTHTASAFEFLWIDSSAGAIQVNLPASANQGDEIRFIDVAGTFDTNNLTIARNGNNIQGVAENLIVDTERAGFSLVYYDATQGWIIKDR